MPFTTEEFLLIFEKYNTTVYPIQILLLIAGLIILFLIKSQKQAKNIFINLFLVFLWLWNGIVYHYIFFTQINPAANIFGIFFIVQAILIFYSGFIKRNLSFQFSAETSGYTGVGIIIFGLLVYPLIGYILLQDMNKVISIGLPCPSVIITFGLFLLAANTFPRYLLIIPTIWAVIGFTAAINFGIYQDSALLLTAIIADMYLFKKREKGLRAKP